MNKMIHCSLVSLGVVSLYVSGMGLCPSGVMSEWGYARVGLCPGRVMSEWGYV